MTAMLTGANVDARYTSLPISAAMISIVMCICGIEWGLERELEGETENKSSAFRFYCLDYRNGSTSTVVGVLDYHC